MIILEAGLLDARGQFMIKTLRANQDTCEIPIIMCSWNDEDVQKEDGANLYLRMPILYSDFLTAINHLGI
jgi:DNA-binding response OmpR family regulator